MDTATYRLLRDVRRKLNRTNLSKAEFRKEEENYCLFLWLIVSLPACMRNPRKPAQ